jgi:spore germination protein YaaH
MMLGGCASELAAGGTIGQPAGAAGFPAPSPVPAPAATATPMPEGFGVEGYLLLEQDSTAPDAVEHVAANAGLVTMVGVHGATISEDGTTLIPESPSSAAVVAEAHALGMKAELLIANFDAELKDFSASIGTALLSNAANRSAVVTQLVDAVVAGGYDSVQLDIEYLGIDDASGLTAFARELDAALDLVPGREPGTAPPLDSLTPWGEIPISIAVMAKASPSAYIAAGYDFQGLLANVDRVVLMGYDQHGASWSGPGPVGGLPWVASSLDALLASGVPASKIDLGIGAYGYSWPGDGSTGTTLRVTDARAIAHDSAEFDAEQGEWTATLDDSTVLWWSDETSRGLRMQLARERGLHGVAIWQLASAE